MTLADWNTKTVCHVCSPQRWRGCSSLLTGCYWCASLLRNDWAGWGRREDLIPRTIRGEGHCSGTKYSRRHGWLAGRLFTQQKVLREMWDLWLMGKGHCAWPSTLLLFWVCWFFCLLSAVSILIFSSTCNILLSVFLSFAFFFMILHNRFLFFVYISFPVFTFLCFLSSPLLSFPLHTLISCILSCCLFLALPYFYSFLVSSQSPSFLVFFFLLPFYTWLLLFLFLLLISHFLSMLKLSYPSLLSLVALLIFIQYTFLVLHISIFLDACMFCSLLHVLVYCSCFL